MSNNKQQPKPENTNNQFSNTEPLTHAQRVAIANTMSNNKQSMKLYTEEQVREIIERAELNQHLTYGDVLDGIFPIELPSDEEIDKKFEPRSTMYELGYRDGAKWLKNKIQGGNK